MTLTLRLAIGCGLIPLAIGTFVFIAFLMTQDSWFGVAGFFNLLAGLALIAAGTGLAIFSGYRSGEWKKPMLAIALLFVNFPAAAAMIYFATRVYFGTPVTVINDSSQPVADLVFRDPRGNHYQMSVVGAHGRRQSKFYFEGEGAVRFSLTTPSGERSGELIGYITTASREECVLRIDADGSVSVEVRSPG